MKDVVIVGGGPGGLQAALSLGRARKQVLLCDAGPRRNALAAQLHNFVTRDGTPPDEFRRVGREQLREYPNVEVRDVGVVGISARFRVALSDGSVVDAKHVLLCTGLVDELLPIDGFRERWGHSIFQCPYCHGWEARDRAWGFLVTPQSAAHAVPFARQLRGWSDDLTVFANGLPIELPDMRVERGIVARIAADAIVLDDGRAVKNDVLFAHPPQRQVPLVQALGLALDADGLVITDPARRETSLPGIYAAGDLSSKMHGAIMAAAAGAAAAAMINLELSQ